MKRVPKQLYRGPLSILLPAALAAAVIVGCDVATMQQQMLPPMLNPPQQASLQYGPQNAQQYPQQNGPQDGPQYPPQDASQYASPQAPEAQPQDAAPPAPAAAADPQLQAIVAPIAIYPDPLVSQVLPASTCADEVKEAGVWLDNNPSPQDSLIDAQPWEPSVRALLHYPAVIHVMTGDMQWTNSLGSAYNTEPADVQVAIQDLRTRAVRIGTLKDSPQASVVIQGPTVAIEPANPAVVYVPTYDPVVVYTTPTVIDWGTTYYPTGDWLQNGIYWDGGVVFVGDWRGPYAYSDGRWGYNRDWHYDRDRYRPWSHDDRYGRAPYVEPARWSRPASMGTRNFAPVRPSMYHQTIVNNYRTIIKNTYNTTNIRSRTNNYNRTTVQQPSQRGQNNTSNRQPVQRGPYNTSGQQTGQRGPTNTNGQQPVQRGPFIPNGQQPVQRGPTNTNAPQARPQPQPHAKPEKQ